MALRELNLVIDVEQRRVISAFDSTLQGSLPPFTFGDSVPLSLRLVRPNPGNRSLPWQEIDLTDQSVRVAIGTPGGKPLSGTFTLSYGGNETASLGYNASSAQVAAALNALASIISAGGVAVTTGATGSYRIAFNNPGARTDMNADTSAIYPSTGAFIARAQIGDSTLPEIVLVRFESQPSAYVELADDLPAADIDVTVTREGTAEAGEIQKIYLNPQPYAGFYTLEIDGESTLSIPFDATSDLIQSALNLLPSIGTAVTVTGDFPLFSISFDASLENVATIVADASGLVVPAGRAGSLNLSTPGIVELLNGATSVTAKFEIELFDLTASTAWTVFQSDVVVIEDVIPNNPGSIPPLPTTDAYIAARAVLHDREQDLDDDARWQALGNLGFTFDDGKLVLKKPDGSTAYVTFMDGP